MNESPFTIFRRFQKQASGQASTMRGILAGSHKAAPPPGLRIGNKT